MNGKRDWVSMIVLGVILLGLLIFAGVYLLTGSTTVGGNIALGLSVVALAVYLFLHPQEVMGGVKSRQARYGGNTLLMTLIFIAILVGVNFLSLRHSKRWDLTAEKSFTLAPETVEILKNLSTPVTVLNFSSAQSGGSRSDTATLLDEYRAQSSKIEVQTIDPDAQPTLARQYGATSGMVVLMAGGRTVNLTSPSESDITGALIKVTRPTQPVVYFTTGHGERELTASDSGGYSQIQDGLTRDGYNVRTMSLALTNTIPADAAVIVIAGPQVSFQPREVDLLRQYLARGGHMAIIVDPSLDKDHKLGDAGLNSLLGEWGMTLRDDLVLDPISRQVADPGVTIAARYGSSPIVDNKKLGNIVTVYPIVRSLDVAKTPPSNVTLTPLVYTSDQSWGAVNFTNTLAVLNSGNFPSQAAQDNPGPLVIAATAENSQTKSRLVVFGGSSFASNGMTSVQSNFDLFLNSVNWLAEQESQITIRPKPFETRQLIPSRLMSIQVFGVSVILMPLAVLLVGLIVWWRRR